MGFIRWLFGSKEKITQSAMKHSTIGVFNSNKRMMKGGHSQKNIDKLNEYGISYNIEKTYTNGVRVGNVPEHGEKTKRTGTNQSWFPKKWNDGKIKKAAQTISRGAKNHDGEIKMGHYANVKIGVIRTNEKIATIFPMNIQKNKKGVEIHERKTIKGTSRKK